MAYLYCPKTLPAMLFAILFGLSTIAHVVQAIVYRKVITMQRISASKNGIDMSVLLEILLGHYHGRALGNCRILNTSCRYAPPAERSLRYAPATYHPVVSLV